MLINLISTLAEYDWMYYHRDQDFSTHDRDNDICYCDCADYYEGGWWYDRCYQANLNGVYGSDDFELFRSYYYNFRLQYAQMKVRPV